MNNKIHPENLLFQQGNENPFLSMKNSDYAAGDDITRSKYRKDDD